MRWWPSTSPGSQITEIVGHMRGFHPCGHALRHLTEWLESKGARLSNLCLGTYEDGERGVHTRAPLQKGQIVLEVPHRLILTEQVARASAIGRQIEASGLALASTQATR